MNRRGFTIVELITTVAIISVLAAIALPKYSALKKRAEAADAVGAMVAIRHAAYAYSAASNDWPPTTATGQIPLGLDPYLPGGNVFSSADYSIAWTASSWFWYGTTNAVQMITVTTDDWMLCQSVSGLLGGVRNTSIATYCGGNGGSVVMFVGE